MAISYQKLFELLSKKNISTYYLRQKKIIGQSSLYKIKKGEGYLGKETLEKFCILLNCQPGDLIAYIPEPDTPQDA